MRILSAAVLWISLLYPPTAFAAENLSSLQAAFLRGDYDAVVQEARRMERQSGVHADGVLYLWGVSELKLGHPEEGRQALSRLVGEHGGSRWRAQAWLALGRSWEEAARDDEALKVYETLLESEGSGPYFSQGALQLAKVQMRLGLWQESRSTLTSLVKRAPQSLEAATAREMLGQGKFYYCAQVGAFSAEPNAARLAAELKRRGYAPEVSQGAMEGKTFYRVRVGRFQSKQEAETELKKLREEGFPGRVFP